MYQLFDYQRNLVNQTRDALAQGNKGVLIVSPPGSGKSVVIAEIAKLTTLKNNRVLFFVHRKELVNQIKNTFKKEGVNLELCTINTVMKIANHVSELPQPSLIIIDEAHHTRASSYIKILYYFKNVPRLGFTATPWRMNGMGFEDIYTKMIRGPQVQWLIDHHRLADYIYVSRSLGENHLLKTSSTGDYTKNSMDNFIKSVNFGNMIETYKRFAKDRKTIVYAPSIHSANLIASQFNSFNYKAVEVDSKTSKKRRDEIMNSFRQGKIKILVNVDLISEGFDVPDCSCVIMLRPTKSLVLYLQQAMRCMRYQPNKKAIIIDHVDNFQAEEKIKVKTFSSNGEMKEITKKFPFGFPRDDRNWTVSSRKKPSSESSLAIKTCPFCFAVILAGCKVCPICGEEIPVEKKTSKKLNLKDDTKMEILDSPDKHNKLFETKYILTQDPSKFTNMKQLSEYAEAKGYKPGWAYYRGKQMGLIR